MVVGEGFRDVNNCLIWLRIWSGLRKIYTFVSVKTFKYIFSLKCSNICALIETFKYMYFH